MIELASLPSGDLAAAPSVLITASAQKEILLTIGVGYAVIVFERGNAPLDLGLDAPWAGTMDIGALCAEWPVLVSVVPQKHAATFERMPPSKTDDILDRAIKRALHIFQGEGSA